MPPASRNHRAPTAGDTPAPAAASSLERPAAIAAQNRRRCSRRATPGRPGDRNTPRNARSERRCRAFIATPPPWCCNDHLIPPKILCAQPEITRVPARRPFLVEDRHDLPCVRAAIGKERRKGPPINAFRRRNTEKLSNGGRNVSVVDESTYIALANTW